MYLQDTGGETKGSTPSDAKTAGQTDDSLRSSDYTQTETNGPFLAGQSAVPPVATDPIPNFSIGNWLLVHLLLSIPIVNLVMLLIWAIGEPKPGKEVLTNYSRASLIWMVISFVVGLIVWVLFSTVILGVLGSVGSVNTIIQCVVKPLALAMGI